MNAGGSRLSNLVWSLGPLLGLVLVALIFGAIEYNVAIGEDRQPQFFSKASLQVVLDHSSMVGVAALGMTLIIIAGGIDLSAGTAIAMTATVIAWVYRDGHAWLLGDAATLSTGQSVTLSVAAVSVGLLTGALCGLINGGLISLLRLVPFIVTLGTMTIFQGTGKTISGNTPIRAFGKVPDMVSAIRDPYPDPSWLLVSPGVWIMLILAVLVALVLRYTVFGRHLFAIGSNESTARLRSSFLSSPPPLSSPLFFSLLSSLCACALPATSGRATEEGRTKEEHPVPFGSSGPKVEPVEKSRGGIFFFLGNFFGRIR